MLTLQYGVGFYLFDCKVFGDTEEANRDKVRTFLFLSHYQPQLRTKQIHKH